MISKTLRYNNVITHVNYKYTGTYTDENSNTYTASISGSIAVTEPDYVPIYNFVPYEELTKEEVLSWIIPQMNMVYLNNCILNSITEQLFKPNLFSGTPW